MVDEDDLARAEEALADRERADLVVGDDAPRVADDVRLTVVQADAERNLLLIKGAVPGPKGGLVLIRDAVKSGALGGQS